MRVCLVSSYPPHKARLSEYAYHLVRELDAIDEIKEIIVLADEARPFIQKFGRKTVIYRVWKPDDPISIFKVIFKLLRLRPDVVHFNMHFFSMGNTRAANTVGLFLIPLCRILGFDVVTTFHHLGISDQDLEEFGVNRSFLNLLGLSLGYFLIAKSKMLISHVKNLRRKPRNVLYIPHGTVFGKDIGSEKDCNPTIIFFGALSPYKGVEYLVEAFKRLNNPSSKLIITDSPHPRFPDYSEKLERIADGNGNITFVKYVPEDDLPSFFSNGSIVVFPYLSNTGTSGAFHTAASFGKATIMSDLPTFSELVDEGAGGLLFPPRDTDSLVKCLKQLLSDPSLIQKIGSKNLEFARSRTWSSVARQYLQVYSDVLTD